jgi:hypothetical protein
MTKSTASLWFPKSTRDDVNAEGFADYLDRFCVWGANDFGQGHGWEAETIPTPDQWESVVAELNEHLESL